MMKAIPNFTIDHIHLLLLHDLPMARWEAARYPHEVLDRIIKGNMHYPTQK